jgi:hypothetical protein
MEWQWRLFEGALLKSVDKPGVLEFEAAIELKALFPESVPSSFRFNAISWNVHGDKEARFCGDDFALFHPYTWGTVTYRDSEIINESFRSGLETLSVAYFATGATSEVANVTKAAAQALTEFGMAVREQRPSVFLQGSSFML